MQQDWQGAGLAQDALAEGLRSHGQMEACPNDGAVPSAAGMRGTEPPSEAEGARRSVRDLTPQELGARGELMAARHLQEKGWEILERNWRCMHGEVDIVARDPEREDAVVLVEVKTRLAKGERDDVIPELAVDASTRRRYRMCALTYLFSHQDVTSVCFDVIAINVAPEGGAHLRHLFNAYSLDS